MFDIVRRGSLAGLFAVSIAALPSLATAPARGPEWASAAAPPALRFALGASALHADCTAAIRRAQAKIDALARTRGPRTFASTVLPLENAMADLNDETVVDTLLASTSTDAAVRRASFACGDDESAFQNALAARPDLYAALAAARSGGTAKTAADRKLTELWYVTFKRSGAGLSPAKRKTFVALGDRLSKLQSDFTANLGNSKATIDLTAAQIAGLPADFVASFAKKGDLYVVPVNESTNQRFFENASDASARKAYYFAAQNVGAPANVALLEEAIGVRDELAHLLGYPNWAAYVLADRMAQTPQRVDAFLDALDAKLLPRARADLATLTQLKAQQTGNAQATIDPWDVFYYDTQLHRTKYAVDDDAIAQYFPVDHVERAVFDIYSKLLGVTFAKRANENVWNPDVTEWTVTDAATGNYIGDFYLDLFPRDGKYSHFANFPLLPNRRMPDGRVRPPLSAIIGNWPKPAPGKPAVLSHDDVETFFHEFGHNMAALLATAPYETLSGGFRQDFIEAPSQMLENWVWDPSVLKQLSSNVTTGEPLPDDLIAKMLAARYVDQAYYTVRQITYAKVDMEYHTLGAHVDTTAVWDRVARETSPQAQPPGTYPQASFGHLMGGYDAGYYGYLWSKVYAQDMFTAFVSGGLESPSVGARYRDDILQPAREREPDDEVRAFLGRPMDPTAFYKEFDREGAAAAAGATKAAS